MVGASKVQVIGLLRREQNQFREREIAVPNYNLSRLHEAQLLDQAVLHVREVQAAHKSPPLIGRRLCS